MARDYAQRGPRRSQVQQKGALPAWAWLVFGLSIGLAVAAFVYISRPAHTVEQPEPGSGVARPPVPATGRKSNERIALPPEEKERFTFYRDLKKQQVYIPRDERPPPVKKQPAAPPAEPLFLIQVASFRAADEAEKEKAGLALLGIEARIEKVTVDDSETYYRVRIGPMTAERAQSTMARLQENGVSGIVVKAS